WGATTPVRAAAARSTSTVTAAPRPRGRPDRLTSRDGVTTGFAARLHARRRSLGTAVCLGLDPRPTAHPLTGPARLGAAHPRDDAVLAAVTEYCTAILDATSDVVAACKPQAAFFEALGPGG